MTVVTVANPDDPQKGFLGVTLGIVADSPVTVDFNLDDVGGPSAGLIFSLGIVDKLTPGDLVGGRKVAGTGTMDFDGRVGPIGGIAQKLAAAHDDGVTLFLAPKDNCDEVLGATPPGLEVAAVESLSEARQALEGDLPPPRVRSARQGVRDSTDHRPDGCAMPRTLTGPAGCPTPPARAAA